MEKYDVLLYKKSCFHPVCIVGIHEWDLGLLQKLCSWLNVFDLLISHWRNKLTTICMEGIDVILWHVRAKLCTVPSTQHVCCLPCLVISVLHRGYYSLQIIHKHGYNKLKMVSPIEPGNLISQGYANFRKKVWMTILFDNTFLQKFAYLCETRIYIFCLLNCLSLSGCYVMRTYPWAVYRLSVTYPAVVCHSLAAV